MVIYVDLYSPAPLGTPYYSIVKKTPLESVHFLSSECLLYKPTLKNAYQKKQPWALLALDSQAGLTSFFGMYFIPSKTSAGNLFGAPVGELKLHTEASLLSEPNIHHMISLRLINDLKWNCASGALY